MYRFIITKKFNISFGYLLLLTFIFGFVTLVIQLFLIDLNPLTSISLISRIKNKKIIQFDTNNYLNDNNDNNNDIKKNHKSGTNNRSSKYINKSLQIPNDYNPNEYESPNNNNHKFEYDYFDKCKMFHRHNLELKDLKRIKYSYLNELKQLELKRKSLIKQLNQLQSQIDLQRDQINKLKQKQTHLNHKILTSQIKSNDLELNSIHKLNLIHMVDKSIDAANRQECSFSNEFIFNSKPTTRDPIHSCSIDTCFNYKKCPLNNKLNLYIYNLIETNDDDAQLLSNRLNKSLVKNVIYSLIKSLNLIELEQSVNLIPSSRLNESCLIKIYLLNFNNRYGRASGVGVDDGGDADSLNKIYYENLIEFLTSTDLDSNILLVSVDESLNNLENFKNYLKNFQKFNSLNESQKEILQFKLSRCLFSSFSYSNTIHYNNLFIHYSFLFDLNYLNEMNELNSNVDNEQLLINLNKPRKYLLSFHWPLSNHQQQQQQEQTNHKNISSLFETKLKILETNLQNEKSVQFDLKCVGISDASGANGGAGASGKENFQCFNLSERLIKLANSKFTLILQTRVDERWSVANTYRLIESLKTSCIPVLVDMDLKLPLDNLIAWDEIVIRQPLARVSHLLTYLYDLDETDLSNRQIKAKNVYNNYFSTSTAMFRTLIASLQFNLNMPTFKLTAHKTNELIVGQMNSNRVSPLSSLNKNNNANQNGSRVDKQNDLLDQLDVYDSNNDNNDEANSYFDNDDEDDEINAEYLGQINQKPSASDEFKNNFLPTIYTTWNRIYNPFNRFPSTPFDSSPMIINKHINTYNQYQIESSILSSSFTQSNLTSTGHDVHYNDDINDDHDDESVNGLREYINLSNKTLGGGDGKFFNYLLSGNYKEEQFTIVILTFKREKVLINQLDSYVKLPYLHTILVVWNSIDTQPSIEFTLRFSLYISSKRIRIVQSRKNSLNNRFIPYDLIKTDAVLSLDDDVLLRPDEIMFAFRVWRENRDRIVGFPARYHTWNFTENNFVYQSYLSCEYSMILTGAAFYHRFYNYYFHYLMDSRIRNKINEIKNCEDIAFNMMVSHLTRKPPIKVTCKWNFYCSECERQSSYARGDQETPISLQFDHYNKRSKCLQYFIKIYGYNPLLFSQYRADSVLFKTKLPTDKQKCFKYL